jgi:transposase InsO family protein
LAEIGAVASIGGVGDNYADALAEAVNGYYKAELVPGPAHSGPWKTIEQLELATLTGVHWNNTQRLHGHLGDVPPAEFEATPDAGTNRSQEWAEIAQTESPLTPG